jgi:hypothetical protein
MEGKPYSGSTDIPVCEFRRLSSQFRNTGREGLRYRASIRRLLEVFVGKVYTPKVFDALRRFS